MARDHQHNPDPNQNASRIVGEATTSPPDVSTDLESAWAAWSNRPLLMAG